jgi:putative endonuclease
MDRKSLGKHGEEIAEKFLKDRKYKILARNFYTRWGELDIVARDKETVVFVEVKARSDVDFARPEESVNFTKQKHLKKAAQIWLLENYHSDLPACRFDVVSVVFDKNDNHTIEHFENAFT